MGTHAHVASSQMAHLLLTVEFVSGCTVVFGSRIINYSQEEAFSNLFSRLEKDKFSESAFFFLPATRVYFVIKLVQATKHQVGLVLKGIVFHRKERIIVFHTNN